MKHIIFDYGGTLDTRGNHWSCVFLQAYRHHDINVSEEHFRQAYIYTERTLGRQPIVPPTMTFRQLLDLKLRLQLQFLMTGRTAGPVLQLDQSSYRDLHRRMLCHIYEQVSQTTEESRRVLSKLSQCYPLSLVSNFYGNLTAVLHEFHLYPLFKQVVESAAVGIRKPSPAIFALAMERAGALPAETLVVGDSLKNDILPAQSLGCQTAWLSGEQWSNAPVPPRTTYTLSTLQELQDILLQNSK